MVRAVPLRLGQIVWPSMVGVLVLMAIYVSGGRVLMGALPTLSSDITALLSRQIAGDVLIGEIRGGMEGFSPRIEIKALSVRYAADDDWLFLPDASVRLNPWESLLSLAPRFDEVTLLGPRFHTADSGTDTSSSAVRDFFWGLFSGFQRVQIRNAKLSTESDDSLVAALGGVTFDLDIERQRSRRTISIAADAGGIPLLSAQGEATGDVLDLSQFSGELHGVISAQGLAYLSGFWDIGLEAEGAVNFWYDLSRGRHSGVLQADLEGIKVANAPALALDAVAVEAGISGSLEEPTLLIQNAMIAAGRDTVDLPRLQIDRLGEGIRVLAEQFDISPVVGVMLAGGVFSERPAEILTTLAPRGSVESLALEIAAANDPLRQWDATLVVADATTDPFRKVPGLRGIDAAIAASESGAKAWIDTRDFELELPEVYHAPIALNRVVGVLSGRWQRDALFLEDGLLLARASQHDASVLFEIDIPLQRPASVELHMRLAAAVAEAPLAIRNHYIPHRMPVPAYQWLQSALLEGLINQATFLWHGGFQPYGDAGQTLQLAADLSDVRLDYLSGWPTVSLPVSQLRIDDTNIAIWAAEGEMAAIAFDDISAGLRLSTGGSQLSISGQSNSNASVIAAGLSQLPALLVAQPVLSDLSINGATQSTLELAFDLQRVADTLALEVAATVTDATVSSALLNLSAADISGTISFSIERGFESSGLTATMWRHPVDIELGPHLAAAPDALLAARISGDIPVSDLLAWQSLPMLSVIDGVAPMTIKAEVAQTVSVSVSSDLAGVSVGLPAPWGKSTESRAPIDINWTNREWAAWDIFWFGRVSAVADFPPGREPAVVIDLTPRTRRPAAPLVAPQSGVRVVGHIPSMDVAEWRDLPTGDFGDGAEEWPSLSVENLTIERLLWQGQELGTLALNASALSPALDVQFSLPWIQGSLSRQLIPPLSEAAANLSGDLDRNLIIDYVDLATLPETEEGGYPDPEDIVAAWMPLSVELKGVHRADTALGSASLIMDYDAEGGWRFSDISGDLLGVRWQPTTHIIWQQQEASELTTVRLEAELDDLATSLELLGVAPLMETRSGAVTADLQWPGGPTDFELLAATGMMDVTMASGSFPSARAETAGAMRLLSLMNLAGLFRRANMNQLFDPGVTFDKAGGQFEFASGKVRIPDFSIEGSGGYFSFESDVDLISETLDGELVVTLPLAENIPWVAALAGGLPVAAGAYLVGKIFEDQVNQLSSGVYSVSGDLDSPKVVFKRVFDAGSRVSNEPDQGSSSEARGSEAR